MSSDGVTPGEQRFMPHRGFTEWVVDAVIARIKATPFRGVHLNASSLKDPRIVVWVTIVVLTKLFGHRLLTRLGELLGYRPSFNYWAGEFVANSVPSIKPQNPKVLEGGAASPLDKLVTYGSDRFDGGNALTLFDGATRVAFACGALFHGEKSCFVVTAGHAENDILSASPLVLTRGTRIWTIKHGEVEFSRPTSVDLLIIKLPKETAAVLGVRKVDLLESSPGVGSALVLATYEQSGTRICYGVHAGPGDEPGLYHHTCATRPGNSGSPLMIPTGQNAVRIAGIHLGFDKKTNLNYALSAQKVGLYLAVEDRAFRTPALKMVAAFLKSGRRYQTESESSRSSGGESLADDLDRLEEIRRHAKGGKWGGVRERLYELFDDETEEGPDFEERVADKVRRAEEQLQAGVADYSLASIRQAVRQEGRGSRRRLESGGLPQPVFNIPGYRGVDRAQRLMPAAVSQVLGLFPEEKRAQYRMPDLSSVELKAALAANTQLRRERFVRMSDKLFLAFMQSQRHLSDKGSALSKVAVCERCLPAKVPPTADQMSGYYLASGGRAAVTAHPHGKRMDTYFQDGSFKDEFDYLSSVFRSSEGLGVDEYFPMRAESLEELALKWHDSLQTKLGNVITKMCGALKSKPTVQPCSYAKLKDEPRKAAKAHGRITNSLSGCAKTIERVLSNPILQGFLSQHETPGDPCLSGIGLDQAGLAHMRGLVEQPRPLPPGFYAAVCLDANDADSAVPRGVLAATAIAELEGVCDKGFCNKALGELSEYERFYLRAVQYIMCIRTGSLMVVNGGDVYDFSWDNMGGYTSGQLLTNEMHSDFLKVAILTEMGGIKLIGGTGDDLALLLLNGRQSCPTAPDPRYSPERLLEMFKSITNYYMRETGRAVLEVTPQRTFLREGLVDLCSTNIFTERPLSFQKIIVRCFSKPHSPDAEVQFRDVMRNWDKSREAGEPSLEEIIHAGNEAGWGQKKREVESAAPRIIGEPVDD